MVPIVVAGSLQADVQPPAAAGDAQRSAEAESSFVDPVSLERANRRLVQVATGLPDPAPLSRLLALALASDGAREGGDLADDHRAVLVAAAFFVNGWPLDRIVPEARSWPRPARRRITLGSRRDHAQHFALSAAMAAYVGSPMADAIAVYKELTDAQGGSGFSFPDVVANRAGQRFGVLAAGSAASAARLAARVQAPLTDGDIMPVVTGLPDSLTEAEFARRFGSVGSAAYNELLRDIDRRIGALALYR